MPSRISRLFAVAMLIVSATAMLSVSFEAEARRMGGGSSLGRQSSNVTQKRQAVTPPAASTAVPPKAAAPAAAGATGAATAKSGMSRWLGPIAGIAAGLGIAALLSHLGLSGAFLEMLSSLILIGVVLFGIMYIVRRMRGMQPAATLSGQGAAGSSPTPQPLQRQAVAPAAAAGVATGTVPAAPVDSSWFIPGDFDTAAFLSQAKARFIEIQAIWDSGDVQKLRDYLTDDLVAELKPQILARSGTTHTEVVLLNAELLGIEAVSGGHLASVRYSGMLREARDAEAFRFEEVWNLYKGGETGWLLAGIQQIPLEYAS